MRNYDVIIIGAGSVGLPTAFFLARERLRVLVIDELPSPGQGQNKSAIGGVRATHSDPAKIQTCQLSLRVFSTWREEHGNDIHYNQGGYCFPVYEEEHEKSLKQLLVAQKKYGLNIDWHEAEEVVKLLPGVNPQGLRGGTYSPEDANISPILAARAFFKQAVKQGAEFKFTEKVVGVDTGNGSGIKVTTDKGVYGAARLINAAGANAQEVGKLMGVDLPVLPDSHEGGVTEPVKPFFRPLVVDMRGFPGSKNFYFYQEEEGHIIFCLTPEPIIPGLNRDSTSSFLPLSARRLIQLFPRLRNIRVRRVWRGLYPMSPDGVPIVDRLKDSDGLYVAVGFCGQGFMLGPGIALNLVNLITKGEPLLPQDIFRSYSLYRDYSRPSEALK
ncbi:MAG: FAD-binding oxidoreductase [Candidatus Zixiibacteriota bacterium]|nr:MAG: FAD-binding oxidoreductase [candidate division Zixibacteria bacterium]